jgi:hypothetical protein
MKSWNYCYQPLLKLSALLELFKGEVYIQSVTIKFPNCGHKNKTKTKYFINTISQHGSHPLQNNVHIAHTMNQMPEQTVFPVLLSVLLSQSVGLMKQPRILSLSLKFFILEINKLASAKLGK